MATDSYRNIREKLGQFIGRTLVDITQHDPEEWEQTHQAYVMFMFDDGNTIKCPIGDDGFDFTTDDPEEVK